MITHLSRVVVKAFCSMLQPFVALIFTETCAQQPLPLPNTPANATPQFPGRSNSLVQVSAKTQGDKQGLCTEWNAFPTTACRRPIFEPVHMQRFGSSCATARFIPRPIATLHQHWKDCLFWGQFNIFYWPVWSWPFVPYRHLFHNLICTFYWLSRISFQFCLMIINV